MHDARLNKKVFNWSRSGASISCKNSIFRITEMLQSINFEDQIYFITNQVNTKAIVTKIEEKKIDVEVNKWKQSLERVSSISGNGRNKLRTYRMLNNVFETETYV
jgi:hypothetical protein